MQEDCTSKGTHVHTERHKHKWLLLSKPKSEPPNGSAPHQTQFLPAGIHVLPFRLPWPIPELPASCSTPGGQVQAKMGDFKHTLQPGRSVNNCPSLTSTSPNPDSPECPTQSLRKQAQPHSSKVGTAKCREHPQTVSIAQRKEVAKQSPTCPCWCSACPPDRGEAGQGPWDPASGRTMQGSSGWCHTAVRWQDHDIIGREGVGGSGPQSRTSSKVLSLGIAIQKVILGKSIGLGI